VSAGRASVITIDRVCAYYEH